MKNDLAAKINLPRESAERLIESIRRLLAEQSQHPEPSGASRLARAIEDMMHSVYNIPPLTLCPGEAHSNPYIDAYGVCSPRWGMTGVTVTVGRVQRRK